jgi:hypothetical protein
MKKPNTEYAEHPNKWSTYRIVCDETTLARENRHPNYFGAVLLQKPDVKGWTTDQDTNS